MRVVKLLCEKRSRSGVIHRRFAVVTEHSLMIESQLSRRALLRATVAASAGLVAGPAILRGLPAIASTTAPPFVDSYQTNIPANQTADTNAAIRALSGMKRLWQTG